MGDIVAEFTVFALAITIAGEACSPSTSVTTYSPSPSGWPFSTSPSPRCGGSASARASWRPLKADILSLTAFEVGLFGWMALMAFVFFPDPHLQPDSPVYWFLMQIGMIIGFATAWPANVWLVRRGIKEPM